MKSDDELDKYFDMLDPENRKRVIAFNNFMVDHPHFTHGFEQAMSAINSAGGSRVVIVTGPTGAGKTTLARKIYKTLRKQYSKLIASDPGCIPVVGLNAVSPNGIAFSWKDFFVRLLQQAGDVLMKRKLLLPRQYELFEGMSAPLPIEQSTADVLRRAVEKCLKNRKIRVLIIDEAHHILMVNDPKRLEFQFEALKSLSIESNVVIVLVGTYRLLAIRDQSGQLVRRSEIVHFPRYNLTQKADGKSFVGALKQLQDVIPLPVKPNLVRAARYFFLKSGGSIGILKDWLLRCVIHAILRGEKTFDADFAEEFALSNKSLITILQEAIQGELALEDVSIDEVKELLYRVASKPTTEPAKAGAGDKPKKKVGTRNPVRDKTGVDHVTR